MVDNFRLAIRFPLLVYGQCEPERKIGAPRIESKSHDCSAPAEAR